MLNRPTLLDRHQCYLPNRFLGRGEATFHTRWTMMFIQNLNIKIFKCRNLVEHWWNQGAVGASSSSSCWCNPPSGDGVFLKGCHLSRESHWDSSDQFSDRQWNFLMLTFWTSFNRTPSVMNLIFMSSVVFLSYLIWYDTFLKIEPCAIVTKSLKNNICDKCCFQRVCSLHNMCMQWKQSAPMCMKQSAQIFVQWKCSHKCACKERILHKYNLYNETIYSKCASNETDCKNVKANQSTQICMDWISQHNCINYGSVSALNNFNRWKDVNWLRCLILIINKKRIIQNCFKTQQVS